jgi:hypothetical protein
MKGRKRSPRTRIPLLLAAILLGAGGTGVLAQTGGGYDLSWFKAAAGGTSSGGAYSLDGAAGQADAGSASGGAYSLDGGFLAAAPTNTPTSGASKVFLPAVIR